MLVQWIHRCSLQVEDTTDRRKCVKVDHAVVRSLLLLKDTRIMIVFPLVLLVR